MDFVNYCRENFHWRVSPLVTTPSKSRSRLCHLTLPDLPSSRPCTRAGTITFGLTRVMWTGDLINEDGEVRGSVVRGQVTSRRHRSLILITKSRFSIPGRTLRGRAPSGKRTGERVLFIRGKRFSVLPIMSSGGLLDWYITEGGAKHPFQFSA